MLDTAHSLLYWITGYFLYLEGKGEPGLETTCSNSSPVSLNYSKTVPVEVPIQYIQCVDDELGITGISRYHNSCFGRVLFWFRLPGFVC